MPDDVAGLLDDTFAEHQALPWEVPLCGSMGVRS